MSRERVLADVFSVVATVPWNTDGGGFSRFQVALVRATDTVAGLDDLSVEEVRHAAWQEVAVELRVDPGAVAGTLAHKTPGELRELAKRLHFRLDDAAAPKKSGRKR